MIDPCRSTHLGAWKQPANFPTLRQNATATYNGTLYGQYGEWVDDTGAGTYIDSDFHHNGHLGFRKKQVRGKSDSVTFFFSFLFEEKKEQGATKSRGIIFFDELRRKTFSQLF